MRKVCVVITARASYSRSKTLLAAIQKHAALELQLIVASSALLERYGQVVSHIVDDGFPIVARIENANTGDKRTSAAVTTAAGISELASVFERIRPDVVVTIADRFETMATAIAAAYMNIPLAHVQGGEVTGNIDEKVRHAITKLADIHFVATAEARKRLIKMGEEPDRIFFTGCPSLDIVIDVLKSPEIDFDPYTLYGGIGSKPDLQQPYLMVLQHPVSTEPHKSEEQLNSTLTALISLQLPVLWFFPNADPGTGGTFHRISRFYGQNTLLPFHFFNNMRPEHFLKLLNKAACLIGNSSCGIREGATLGIPAVNIGNRQDGRERGQNVIDAKHASDSIMEAAERQLARVRFAPDFIYGKGNAGQQIAGLLAEIPLTFEKKITY
ncbi:UDP-N-acetylglucosamine 2-epimerase [Dyadobacter sp.]|uniref:UDP-N-acetylglucosamine 2-epimerase n=1 Tax=Dyadobacter sp. TaxID=1914288 RepID=UPI003F7191F2